MQVRLPSAIASMLALASVAHAETLVYGVDAGVAESDNVTLAATDKVSQTIAVVDADFDVKQQTRLLDLTARGNFSYLDYLQNAFGNQLLGRFDGVGKIAVIPDRLSWVLQDDFGQAALDPFTPTIPTNLENVNYVSTGPDLALRVGGTGFVNASARYARVQFATSPFNSNRLQGSVGVGEQLSSASTISVNADFERVLFENTLLNTDFDRTNGFALYEIKGARTELSAQIGATEISQAGNSSSGGLARFELARRVSAAVKLTLSVGRNLTDAGSSFSSLQGGAVGIVGNAPAPQTSNSYTDNYASAGWQYKRSRTTVRLSGRWERALYGGASALDYTREGAEFFVERRFTRALSGQLLGHYYKTDYGHALSPVFGSANYDDESLGGALVWRHGRGLEFKLRAEHTARIASGNDAGYRENRVLLTVGYRPAAIEPVDPLDSIDE